MRHSFFFYAALVVLSVWLWPSNVSAQSCTNNSQCPVGDVCHYEASNPALHRTCQNLSLDLANPSVSSTSISGTLQQNGIGVMNTFGCLGTAAICSTQPTTNSLYWRATGSGVSVPFTYGGLRSGRAYRITFQGQENGSVDNIESPAQVTWPGYQTPTDLNLQVSNVTDTSATISWTTPFDSDTRIMYHLARPTTNIELPPLPVTEDITDFEALPNGQAWAVTNLGRAFKRGSSGVWTVVNTGMSYISQVSVSDEQHIWLGGLSGAVQYSTDGGGTWTTTTITSGQEVFGLYAATSTTAWAITRNGILAYLDQTVNPTNWQNKQTIGTGFYAVFSHDDKSILVSGDNGRLWQSNNGGSTGTVRNIASAGVTLTTIASLDGKNVWIGGTQGNIVQSNDGGLSWANLNTAGTDISGIQMVNPTAFWFTELNRLGRYDATATPNFLYDLGPVSTLGSNLTGLAMVHGSKFILRSQNDALSLYAQNGNSIIQDDITPVKNHSFTFPNGSLQAGSPYYFSIASHGSNVSAGTFGTFTTTSPDNEPPQINFTNPASTPTYTNVANLNATGTADDNIVVQSITLTRNGTPQTVNTNPALPVNAPGPGQRANATWSSSLTLQSGINTLLATAADASPTSADGTATRTVYLDTQAPTVTITVPGNGSTVNTSTITSNGTAIDNSVTGDRVVSMQYELNSSGTRQNISITPGANVSWTIPILGPLNLGSNRLTVYARDRANNEGSATVTFTYAEPTFTLSVTPSSQTRNPGDAVVYNWTLTSVNGFANNVTLSASGSPVTPSFSPQPANLTAGGTVSGTMTITTTPTTPTGTFPITVAGNGAGKTATANVTLILTGFTLSANPLSRSILGGQNTTYQVRATADGNFTGNVAFTISGLPSGVSANFVPTSVSLSPSNFQETTLNISTTPAAAAGAHTLTVTGTSGSLVKTQTLTLTISAPPDITLTITPSSRTINAGQSTTYDGTATAVNGYNENTTVTVASNVADPNLTFMVTPSQFVPTAAPGTAFVINVSTTSAVASGLYTLTVTAANPGGTITKSQTVTLQIDPDTTPPIISNIVATPNWNDVRISWDTNELADSAIAIYSDAARTSPVGVLSDGQYCLSTCHNMFYQPLQPTTTYYFTVTSCDQDTSAPPPTPNCATATTDAGGNPLQFTTLPAPDNEPPIVIAIDTPLDGDTVFGTVAITGRASDNQSVTKVHVEVTNASDPTAPPVFGQSVNCVGVTCSFTSNWNTTSLFSGQYIITAIAQDTTNFSAPVSITVTVDNNAPLLCPGTDVIANPSPIAGQNNCGGGQCWQAVISWCTTTPATTEVDYGTSVNCSAGGCSYPNPTVFGDPANPLKVETNHQVTLTNLDADQLYHYRITSCKVASGAATSLCTH